MAIVLMCAGTEAPVNEYAQQPVKLTRARFINKRINIAGNTASKRHENTF
jgi:hypothetical protein